MSTVQACTEPDWFMKQMSDEAYGRTFGDLNGVYTITNLAAPSDDSNILKATVDGVALQAGDAVFVMGQEGQTLSCAGGGVMAWSDPSEYDITLSVDDRTISFKDMYARIERLEQQVEMWKSAAMTLKEINDEIRNVEEPITSSPLLEDLMELQHDIDHVDELRQQFRHTLEREALDEAYERAKKFTR